MDQEGFLTAKQSMTNRRADSNDINNSTMLARTHTVLQAGHDSAYNSRAKVSAQEFNVVDVEETTLPGMKSYDLKEDTQKKHDRQESSFDSIPGGVSVQVDSAGFASQAN